ncbi:MAG: transposase [Candidatus Latescibacteria bacterium]|nr:transposase [Candidatus Latescibacterota bacterium]
MTQVHIRHLERRISRLEDEGLALVLSTDELCAPFQRLLSIPGVGEASAWRVLAELAVLPDDMKPPQWGAHAGLDPRPHESGSSLHPPGASPKRAISICGRLCICRPWSPFAINPM